METKEQPMLMGFLDGTKFDNGIYRGGCLVTDKDTYPIEFRVTSPIEPTSLQQILYGRAIVNYIYTELIAVPITKKLTSDLKFFIVKKKELLQARPKLSKPVLYIDIKSEILSAHSDFPNESKLALQLQNMFSAQKLIEPFERVNAALKEAQKRNIGIE